MQELIQEHLSVLLMDPSSITYIYQNTAQVLKEINRRAKNLNSEFRLA